jgi:Na+(H+)/acetate symporter ActP
VIAQFAGWHMPWGLHAGFVGLVLNFVVAILVSTVTRPPDRERIERFERFLAE